MPKVGNQNSNGVLGNPNRAVTYFSHPESPDPFCIRRGASIHVRSDAVCPDCGHPVTLVVEFTRSYPFDDVLELHTRTRRMYCTTDGCDTDVVTQPYKPPTPPHRVLSGWLPVLSTYSDPGDHPNALIRPASQTHRGSSQPSDQRTLRA